MTSIRMLPLLLAVLSLAACSQSEPPENAAAQTDAPAPPAVTDLRQSNNPAAAAQPAAEPGKPAAVKTEAAPETAATGGTKEIEWDNLIPDDFQPEKLMEEFNLDEISDDDPRAEEFMAKLKELWDKAPVRQELDGQAVKIPGFVVPVEGDEKETTGFLLVPYYGACVHVPPPPANQTIYVVTEAGKGTKPNLFDVIWVSGTMSVQRIDNDVAEAGYTLYASDIAPYE